MPYPASVIAYAFVKKGMQEKLPVTQMKLQKMVYFAHGLYMAINGSEPLIQEEFEAWQFGPVVPEIYRQYRSFGTQPVSYNDDEALEKLYLGTLAKDTTAIYAIDYTWQVTKNLSAYTLSNWTHLTGSPWSMAYKPGFSSIPIDNIIISKYFRQMLETASHAPAFEPAAA